MADFCEQCGKKLGFFSKKTIQQYGKTMRVCPDCADKAKQGPRAAFQERTDAVPDVEIEADEPLTGDFRSRIITLLLRRFKKENGIDLSTDEIAMTRIIEVAAKHADEIEANGSAEFNLPFITADLSGPRHLNEVVTMKDLGK